MSRSRVRSECCTTRLRELGGMKITPPLRPRTTSPGITSAWPMRVGPLMLTMVEFSRCAGRQRTVVMRRIVVADEGGEVLQLIQTVDVAHRAVVDNAVARPRIDGVAHVVANRRSVHLQPEVVRHIDVARLQHVHRPGVLSRPAGLFYAFCSITF